MSALNTINPAVSPSQKGTLTAVAARSKNILNTLFDALSLGVFATALPFLTHWEPYKPSGSPWNQSTSLFIKLYPYASDPLMLKGVKKILTCLTLGRLLTWAKISDRVNHRPHISFYRRKKCTLQTPPEPLEKSFAQIDLDIPRMHYSLDEKRITTLNDQDKALIERCGESFVANCSQRAAILSQLFPTEVLIPSGMNQNNSDEDRIRKALNIDIANQRIVTTELLNIDRHERSFGTIFKTSITDLKRRQVSCQVDVTFSNYVPYKSPYDRTPPPCHAFSVRKTSSKFTKNYFEL